jgi:cyclopropane-fatty-acyl-phospholipid synthase
MGKDTHSFLDRLLETNRFPEWLIRIGVRRLLAQRLNQENKGDIEAQNVHKLDFARKLKQSPIALHTQAANEQHYEVPTRFFQLVLGRNLKYSSGLWMPGTDHLDEAEEAMLRLTCQRGKVEKGLRILELGCGWGSLSLWISGHFPDCEILALSNSRTQKEHIDSEIAKRGLKNLRVVTADINEFNTEECFDRVLSVEMFEHVRNWDLLLSRIASWLSPKGLLFVHIFTHREYAYFFENKGPGDWMSRNFFTGGMMPSDDLFLYFQDEFVLREHWRVNGLHYARTAEAWLANMERNKVQILSLFQEVYGPEETVKWYAYWKVFLIACAELWGYRQGQEWLVSHYLFESR